MSPCPHCGAPLDPRLLPSSLPDDDTTLHPPVACLLARTHPGAALCPACVQQAARAFARSRSAFPLHTRTEPHTTFPYYHPDEETVLGVTERLPRHTGFDGAGVTIGFLDSGYYPHPDLAAAPLPAGLALDRLTPRRWRALLEEAGTRFADYVDLAAGRSEQGLHLDGLWDGQGVAWHGQMTTVLAAGSGRLSGGRYRGFAPGACLLPIRVGRGDGRIPESDILVGLEWLLAERRWERLGVRVLNISIGGDYPQTWHENPVCRAAERLAARGVLIVAAAGNRPIPQLLAPAQAPSVLTVGGVDDGNRPVDPRRVALALYHHSHGVVGGPHGLRRKPELLAPAAYLPGPVLPLSPIFREMQAIARLRETLQNGADASTASGDDLVAHWQRVLHTDAGDEEGVTGEWMGDVWQAVRRRMNTHKWVHACYQHVDGTSVAAAVVSGVAAQMLQANPSLSPGALRALLCETALPLPHLPAETQGAGLVQPTAAVAAALRAPGGRLAGLPHSGRLLGEVELQKWADGGRVALSAPPETGDATRRMLYVGLLAPAAARVSVTGSFNRWQPGLLPLEPAGGGWWHTLIPLPAGTHAYRFWTEMQDGSHRWLPDPENPLRGESGYREAHSEVNVP